MARSGKQLSITVENGVEMLQAEKLDYVAKIRHIRRQLMASKSRNPLSQAVLGMTGSEAEMNRYRSLAEKVVEQTGEPLVVIKNTLPLHPESGANITVQRAEAGIITGPLAVKIGNNHTPKLKRPLDETNYFVQLQVPVRPKLLYYVNSTSGEDFVFDYQTHTDPPSRNCLINVADFAWHQERRGSENDPSKDVFNAVDFENVLVGRTAIYGHQLWHHGIVGILDALEQEAKLRSRTSETAA